MNSSKLQTFTEMTKCHPSFFVSDCFMLPVDVACDYIDHCYAQLNNPSDERYSYYVESIRHFMLRLKNIDPTDDDNTREIAAYLRAFPKFDFEAYGRELIRATLARHGTSSVKGSRR